MTHDSNYWGKIGANNPGLGADAFKKGGASDSQAAEAAAAAARAAANKK